MRRGRCYSIRFNRLGAASPRSSSGTVRLGWMAEEENAFHLVPVSNSKGAPCINLILIRRATHTRRNLFPCGTRSDYTPEIKFMNGYPFSSSSSPIHPTSNRPKMCALLGWLLFAQEVAQHWMIHKRNSLRFGWPKNLPKRETDSSGPIIMSNLIQIIISNDYCGREREEAKAPGGLHEILCGVPIPFYLGRGAGLAITNQWVLFSLKVHYYCETAIMNNIFLPTSPTPPQCNNDNRLRSVGLNWLLVPFP